jgi:hypothetical protein
MNAHNTNCTWIFGDDDDDDDDDGDMRAAHVLRTRNFASVYVFIQGVQSPAHDIFPSPAETLSCDPSAVRSPLAACRNEMRAAIADCLQQQRQKQTTTQATRPARQQRMHERASAFAAAAEVEPAQQQQRYHTHNLSSTCIVGVGGVSF